MASVLLIEPDHVLAKTIAHYIESEHELAWVPSGHHAIKVLDKKPFDVIVTEHLLSGHNSFEFLYELRSYPEWQNLPVILFSRSYIDEAVLTSESWRQLGNVHYLYKPSTSLALLVSRLNRLVG